jgi:glycosyltransferase involved in cell wall biosynthesis
MIIVGTGFIDRALKIYINSKGLSNNIIMTGKVSISLLYKLIKIVDLVAIPSLYEAGVPYAALEVLALKKPLLISKLPFITEFLSDEDVILVNPYDPMNLFRSLCDIVYSGQRELCKIADRGHQKAKYIFSPAEYANKMVTLYSEIAKY